MPDILDQEFLLVIGKGGVGKTTVSAALALAAARRGKRVLVAMCNAKERLSRLLDTEPIGPRNRRIRPNIDAVNMTPRVALEEYGMMVLKVKTLYRAIFENRFVSALLRGIPGIEAWSLLGKAYFHVHEQDDSGRPRYDLVILDAPATGHGLEMLRVPEVILRVAPPGLLRREAEKAMSLFRDTKRSAAVVVTLAEEMPVSETLELHHELTEELKIPVGKLVVNQVLPRLFSTEERGPLQALPATLEGGSPLHSLAIAGRARSMREEVQEESLARLKKELPEVPETCLPMLHVVEFDSTCVEELSRSFDPASADA
jgi:anion-transporting  ArsA/GET3 family ATPase